MMKKYQRKWTVLSLLLLGTALIRQGNASAQTAPSDGVLQTLNLVAPVQGVGQVGGQGTVAPGTTLPMWQFSTTSPADGNTYTGWMVGRSPFFHGARTTTIPTYLVPLIVNMPDGGVFDSTVPDSTCLSGNTPKSLFLQSPLLNNTSFSFGGTAVGTTQYGDAFQRANFWNANVAATGNSYHTLLGPASKVSTPVTVLSPVTIPVAAGFGATYQSVKYSANGCGSFGVVDFQTFDTYLRTTVLPSLVPSFGVNPNSLVVFLMYNVVEAYPGIKPSSNCCSLGYHGASIEGSSISPTAPIQTYIAADFDSTGIFGNPDVASISHQLGAWMDDPLGINTTPSWTPPVGNCQTNLDVGYPLLGILLHPGAATSAAGVQVATSFTYDLQELVFFSWFYRQSPSLGVNGWFSTDDGLTSDAGALCAG